MFKQNTIFILGAGASLHYGYPLGKDLISDIITNMEDEIFLPRITSAESQYYYNNNDKLYALAHFENELNLLLNDKQFDIVNNFRTINYTTTSQDNPIFTSEIPINKQFIKIKIEKIEEFNNLKKALTDFAPISIDTFLRDNPSHEFAGTVMIIYSLLKAEATSKFQITDTTKPKEDKDDNWYSHLINDILAGMDINKPEEVLQNNLNIITFNYDLSLDYCIYKKIGQIEILKKKIDNIEIGCKFWSDFQKNIKHVYGQLYPHSKIENYGKFMHTKTNKCEDKNFKRFLNAYQNQSNIYSMYQNRSNDIHEQHFKQIREIINNAKDIFIIGFSFDRDNLNVLGFIQDFNEWQKFSKGKKIRYLDYEGKMEVLANQFKNIEQTNDGYHTSIIRSVAKKITSAYQNDFKISLY